MNLGTGNAKQCSETQKKQHLNNQFLLQKIKELKREQQLKKQKEYKQKVSQNKEIHINSLKRLCSEQPIPITSAHLSSDPQIQSYKRDIQKIQISKKAQQYNQSHFSSVQGQRNCREKEANSENCQEKQANQAKNKIQRKGQTKNKQIRESSEQKASNMTNNLEQLKQEQFSVGKRTLQSINHPSSGIDQSHFDVITKKIKIEAVGIKNLSPNQIKQLNKQIQQKINSKSKSLNIPTNSCIQISSQDQQSNDQYKLFQNQKLESKDLFHQNTTEIQDTQSVEVKPNKNLSPLKIDLQKRKSSSKTLFHSAVQINYVTLSRNEILNVHKEWNRLKSHEKSAQSKDFKVKLKQKTIQLSPTINIQYIAHKIAQAQWIIDQLRNYRFWVFKGLLKNLEQAILQKTKRNQLILQSKYLINLHQLCEWYTLAHLLSASTNLVFVLQKTTPEPIIMNIYPSRCQFCKSGIQQICLCLRIFNCKYKSCCQDCQEINDLHKKSCKYAYQYKGFLIKSQFNPDTAKGLVGIVNPRNSCFMNTALQCLAACQPLNEYFLHKNFVKDLNLGNYLGTFGEIACRYADFIKESFSSRQKVLQLNRLKRSICKWDNKYLQDQQQDSQQFLSQFMDWMKQDLNLNQISPAFNQTFHQAIQQQEITTQIKAKKVWERYVSRNNSIIEYLMAGMLKSSLQCSQCLFNSQNYETFLSIPLPVQKSIKQSSQGIQIKVCICMVYKNFSKRNQSSIIKLQNYWYDDLIDSVKQQFELDKDSTLICFSFKNNKQVQIIDNSFEGSNQIKKATNKNSISLIFLQYSKEQIQNHEVQISFILKLAQNNKLVSSIRYLFFRKKQHSTPKNIFQKLLSYFYKVMFRNPNNLTQQQYIDFYLKQQNLPFKIFLQQKNQEIQINSNILLHNKTSIVILFQSDANFNIRLLLSAQTLKKQMKNEKQHSFQQKTFLKMSLFQCFKQFEKSEIMDFDNSWYCPQCKEKRKAFKKITIYKTPKILILFFKRFSSTLIKENGEEYHSMKKIDTFVEFPHEVNLNEFIQKNECPYTGQKCDTKYRLFAVSNHVNLGSQKYGQIGHYNAFTQHYNQWYLMNDSKVMPIGQGDVCTKNAYILYYSRIEQ